jgi:hypothetical protein
MFANTKAFSGFAVDDLEAARGFYADTLGIDVSGADQLLTLRLAGGRDTPSTSNRTSRRRPTRS